MASTYLVREALGRSQIHLKKGLPFVPVSQKLEGIISSRRCGYGNEVLIGWVKDLQMRTRWIY